MNEIYDLIIIGGGPAGASAAVYAARKRLKTLVITPEWGGQSVVSDDIQNWIGTPHISGMNLAKSLESHVKEYQSDILTIAKTKVITVSGQYGDFSVVCENNNTYNSKTILITTGSNRRKLDVIGADKLEHKGLTYCASCDGPLYRDAQVAVIGGGNAAFESAAQLLAYCKKVYLLNRTEHFRADEITIEKLSKNPNLVIVKNAVPIEVHGDMMLNAISYKDATTNEIVRLEVEGVFVEIGQLPQTDFLANVVDRDAINKIKIDPWTCKTSKIGIWAAGDCTNILYHQNNIASGEAVKALEDIYVTLKA